MKLELNFGSAVTVLPAAAAPALKNAQNLDIRVLFEIAALAPFDLEETADEVCRRLKCARSDFDAAIAYWRGAGVLTQPDASRPEAGEARLQKSRPKKLRSDEVPKYTGEQLEDIDRRTGLRALIDECQKITGKLLNPTEINKIAAMRDYLGLDSEYILLLFSYCKNTREKHSVHYVEKTAYGLYDEGVDTLSGLEEYIKEEERRSVLSGKLRTLFGIGSRALSAREKEYIRVWSEDWGYDEKVIGRAYQITVDNTEKLSLPYLNKVLSNWHDAGYRNEADVDAALEQYQAQKQEKITQKEQGSFDTDSFFEAALRRTYRKTETKQ